MEKKTSWVIQDDGLIHETVEGQHKENWKEKYEKEHKLRQEAEGELTIVKTITIDSSPEMREAKKEITELKKEICELRQDNRKLAKQIEDLLSRLEKLRHLGVL